jgi:hypothetical protein
VYAKRRFAGPQQFLDYAGRYTHRVAISSHRLLDIDGGQVRFTYKDYRADVPNSSKIRPILQAIRDKKRNIRPIIEFEYRIPEGSDRGSEIKKYLAYCQESLLA